MSRSNAPLQAPSSLERPVLCTYCGDSRIVTDRVDGEITCPECGYGKGPRPAADDASARATHAGGIDVAEWRRAMENVTPGKWQVVVDEHPWSLPERKVLGQTLPTRTGHHLERRIFTILDHPQLKAPDHVVTMANGIGLDGEDPVRMVSIRDADAAWIARCSTVGVGSLLDALEAAELRSEEASAELTFIREASARWMEETGQAHAFVGIRDYAAACERAESHERLVAELRTENERLRDFGETSVEVAERILENLGIGQDASREPGADRRRDRIAAMIERAMEMRSEFPAVETDGIQGNDHG